MAEQAHKGDIGTKISIDLAEDVSTATVRKIKYHKPSGSDGEWTAAADGTTAVSFTTTAVADLDEAGRWELQAYVEMPAPWKGHATITVFDVLDVLAGAP